MDRDAILCIRFANLEALHEGRSRRLIHGAQGPMSPAGGEALAVTGHFEIFASAMALSIAAFILGRSACICDCAIAMDFCMTPGILFTRA